MAEGIAAPTPASRFVELANGFSGASTKSFSFSSLSRLSKESGGDAFVGLRGDEITGVYVCFGGEGEELPADCIVLRFVAD